MITRNRSHSPSTFGPGSTPFGWSNLWLPSYKYLHLRSGTAYNPGGIDSFNCQILGEGGMLALDQQKYQVSCHSETTRVTRWRRTIQRWVIFKGRGMPLKESYASHWPTQLSALLLCVTKVIVPKEDVKCEGKYLYYFSTLLMNSSLSVVNGDIE